MRLTKVESKFLAFWHGPGDDHEDAGPHGQLGADAKPRNYLQTGPATTTKTQAHTASLSRNVVVLCAIGKTGVRTEAHLCDMHSLSSLRIA